MQVNATLLYFLRRCQTAKSLEIGGSRLTNVELKWAVCSKILEV